MFLQTFRRAVAADPEAPFSLNQDHPSKGHTGFFVNSIEYFFWLAGQAFGIFSLFPPAWILALVGVALMFAQLSAASVVKFDRKLLAILPPALIPIIILWWGVQFKCPQGAWRSADQSVVWMIKALLFSHLPLAILLTFKLKELRLFAFGVSTLMSAYSLGAAALSTMSVTGHWL